MKKLNLDWESLCKRCGQCCHIKHRVGKEVIIDPEMVCKHLQDDNTCAIYHNRLSGHCVSIVEALQKHEGLVPATCGYLHYAPGYRPALAPETMDEFWQLVARHGTICMVSLKRLFPDSNAKKKELEVE